jgi:hypothetical protein
VPALAAQFAGQDFPVATDAARRMVTLPVHGYVRHKDRRKILMLFHSRLSDFPKGQNMEVKVGRVGYVRMR